MANENRESKKATLRILELMQNERPIDVIVWQIMVEFGYGERFTKRVINAYKANVEAREHMKHENKHND